jgi:ketosteroid isomerase-like protein
VAEIRALKARLVKAVSARDLDGVMAAWVPDDSFFVFGTSSRRGSAWRP